MHTGTPIVKDLVLIGGGHAHLAVVKSFGMAPLPGVRLTLISRDSYTPYSGMLPGLITGQYSFEDAHVDLTRLAQFAAARFVRSEVIGIDPAVRRILLRDRPALGYDLLSVNCGSTPSLRDVEGAAEHALAVKPIQRFLPQWQRLRERVRTRSGPLRIGVVGGGAGGVELLLAIEQALGEGACAEHMPLRFHLLTTDHDPLGREHPRVARRIRRVLARRGIEVHTGARVTAVRPGRVECASGEVLALDEVLLATHASPPAWIAGTGLALDERGWVLVDDCLRSVSHPSVFAAGDIASQRNQPRPKSGVFAVRHGPVLARNLRRALLGRALVPYRPQSRALSLIRTGDREAVAVRGWWSAQGRWIWGWKDWIDRRFMRSYQVLPPMRVPPPAWPPGLVDPDTAAEIGGAQRCGGCGAKVGAAVLARVLPALERPGRDDVMLGIAAADDAAVLAPPAGKLLVWTIDAFRPIVDDPYVAGQIAATHCLNDVYAMGATPQAALALVTLPPAADAPLAADLEQLLTGARAVLDAEHTLLVGGHTGEGVETSIGFAIAGYADAGGLWRQNGLCAGDRIILTKPLGTGALFAAHMRGAARGAWIDAAVRAMLASNRAASVILREHGTRACTDVSGFGLLGHLAPMLVASAVGATLELDSLPLLDGAVEAGFRSSLYPRNARRSAAVATVADIPEDPRWPLLFDPQTAGGLLAAVPSARADACLEALRAAGYRHSAIVATVTSATGAAPVRIVR